MSDRVAVYCASQALYRDCVPAIKSMILNGKPDRIYLLIEDDEFPEWLPPIVKVVNVGKQKYFPLTGPNIQTRFTFLAIMRGALAKVLPDEDKVLSLDCDTFVVGNIDELWDIDISEYYVSASIEPVNSRWDNQYYNTGVAMFNLALMREDGIDDEIIDVLNKNKLTCPEQDAINIVCKRMILDMPSEFNANNYTRKTEEIRIKHYAGFGANQWAGMPEAIKFRNMTWDKILNH